MIKLTYDNSFIKYTNIKTEKVIVRDVNKFFNTIEEALAFIKANKIETYYLKELR